MKTVSPTVTPVGKTKEKGNVVKTTTDAGKVKTKTDNGVVKNDGNKIKEKPIR
jgi:hypothetical protein